MFVDFNEISKGISKGSYRNIGSGSGRRVFDLNNGYVVKVAKNKKGFAQNEAEYRIAMMYKSRIMANIAKVSSDFKYLIMVKAERIPSFSYITSYYKLNDIQEMKDVRVLIQRFDLVKNDLYRNSSWGVISGRPVIVDYGFTNEIRSKYYARVH